MVVGVEYLERKVAFFVVDDPKLAPTALLAHRCDLPCAGTTFVGEESLGVPDGAVLKITGEDGRPIGRARPLDKLIGGAARTQHSSGAQMRECVLALVRGHIERYGYPPSSTQLGRALGKDHSTILHHLRKLQAQGLVTWEPGVSRSVRLTAAAVGN